ncbi:MAG: hypothetical protein ILO53_07035 [Clostridia bacterium]|nr:hypothetical protein [Clostridia bacterium]
MLSEKNTAKSDIDKIKPQRRGAFGSYCNALLLLLAMLLAAACFALQGCGILNDLAGNPGDGKTGADGRSDVPEFFKISENKPVHPQVYVDLSHWEENADIELILAQGAKGIILRLARYNMELDESFLGFYEDCKRLGVPVGCFYFSGAHSIREAEKEAEAVLDLIAKYDLSFELPVFYDIENDGDRLMSDNGRNLLTNIIRTFCEKLMDAGIVPGYYSNSNFARNYYYPARLTDFCFWLADYSHQISGYEYENLYLWQYSPSADIWGVSDPADVNLLIRDLVSYTSEMQKALAR